MRCFVAIDIDNALKPKIEDIQKEIAINGVNIVALENLHITLKFLDDLTEEQVKKADHILQRIDYPKFKIDLATIGAFPNINNPRTIWIGLKNSEKIKNLSNIIERDFSMAGFPRSDNEFNAHLTVARIKDDLDLSNILEKLKDTAVGRQEVISMALKQSILTNKGPVYSDIKRYIF